MAPNEIVFSESHSPPTMWGIDVTMHPLEALNMERSREEGDEQLRR